VQYNLDCMLIVCFELLGCFCKLFRKCSAFHGTSWRNTEQVKAIVYFNNILNNLLKNSDTKTVKAAILLRICIRSMLFFSKRDHLCYLVGIIFFLPGNAF